METVITTILILGAICACLNICNIIADNKSKEKIEQTEEIIVKKKDGINSVNKKSIKKYFF